MGLILNFKIQTICLGKVLRWWHIAYYMLISKNLCVCVNKIQVEVLMCVISKVVKVFESS